MAWQELNRHEIGEGVPSISIGTSCRSGRATYGQIVINISATLARILGVSAGDRVDVFLGTLADEGWMKLAKGSQYKLSHHGHSGSVRVRFSGRKWDVTETNKPKPRKFKVSKVEKKTDRTWVAFTLPKYLRDGREKFIGSRAEERE